MEKRNIFIVAILMAMIIQGCEKNNEKPPVTDYSAGVYIVNEGSYGQTNGSISHYDPSTGEITNGIFEAANGRPLGDVVQSFSVVGDTSGYILVNGSGKLEIVRLKDFSSISEPIPVTYPRYFLQVGPGKGYLSAGSMQGWIYVLDLASRQIADSVRVGYGPEMMVRFNNRVFVANSGGWGSDSTISVLDMNTDEVISLFNVGKVPVDLALDSENKLWVYCKGLATYNPEPPYDLISETDALLQKIDPASGEILWQLGVGKAGDYTATPPRLAISKEGDHILYLRPEGVFKVTASNPNASLTPFIPGGYYGLEVNPADGNIYLFETTGFTGNGIMKIFDQAGNPQGQGVVGIAPNGAAFSITE